MDRDPAALPFPGLRALDHAADVGLEVGAPDLPELVRRAALGMTWLLLEREPSGAPQERPLQATAEEPASLLREVLRELLWWHEAEGLAAGDLAHVRVRETSRGLELTASARLVLDEGTPVREIKGVTLHGLVVERREGGWYGRVIFDV
jgi:SHS2 domain-containing protein